MIKLIASDMDGTLLPTNKEFPTEIYSLIHTMTQNGTIFAVASARNYYNLRKNFEPVKDEIAFICDNGAFVSYQGKELHKEPLDKKTIAHLVAFCETIEHVHLILCAKERIYYHKPSEFEKNPENCRRFNVVYAPDLKAVDDDIFRIGLIDPQNPLKHSIPLIKKEFGDELNIIATDETSVDIMKPGVNKGSGIACLQNTFKISQAQTMAFGDYYNDIGMLKLAGYSFAMENAPDDIKQHCNYIAKSNDEKGVIQAIREFYLPSIKTH